MTEPPTSSVASTQTTWPSSGLAPLLRHVARAPFALAATLPRDIGSYRLLGRLGRGGMGEVYEALDLKLNRKVALKILPGRMATSEARVRRFIHEAKAASALNHPHIVTIYEVYWAQVPEAPGGLVHCIAMELIEGRTLRRWLQERTLKVTEVLDLSVQVAEGLAKAHASGIVHRDLKPSNIMVTEEGFAKILDFGLAKLTGTGPILGDQPEEPPLTRDGAVVGTPGYMSPEQIRGEPLDGRSDLFALGCILHEALTGDRPFASTNAVEVLHEIAHGQPPSPGELCPEVPEALDVIVRRCLAAAPASRYQSTQDLLADLRHLQRSWESGRLDLPLALPSSAPTRPLAWWAPAAVAILAVGLAGAYGLWRLLETPAPVVAPTLRIERLTFGGQTPLAAIAPDGRLVAYVRDEGGRRSVWVRQVRSGSTLRIVPPIQGKVTSLTISPDGNHVYYVVHRGQEMMSRLRRVPILGGASQHLLTDLDSPVTFAPDGKHVAFVRYDPLARRCALMVARANGGEERTLVSLPFSRGLRLPAWSPDGRSIAVSAMVAGGRGILVFPAGGGAPRRLGTASWTRIGGLAWLPRGNGLALAAANRSVRATQLWRVSFPDGRLHRITNDASNYWGVGVSADGRTLVATQYDRRSNLWLAEIDSEARPRQLTWGGGRYRDVTWAPDGSIVFSSITDGTWDLWRIDARGRAPRRLTTEAGANLEPAVSPDGRVIAFVSDRSGGRAIWRMGIDGSSPRRLTRTGSVRQPSFSPDGRWIVYTSYRDNTQSLWRIPAGGGPARRLTRRYAGDGTYSPDGKWIATGFWNSAPDSPWQIGLLPAGGGEPLRTFPLPPTASRRLKWLPSGRGVTYLDHRRGVSNVWIQPIDGEPARRLTSFTSGRLFRHAWDTSGRRLVLLRGLSTSDAVLVRGF